MPVKRGIEEVQAGIAYPLQWGTNKKGMQAGEPLQGAAANSAQHIWREACQTNIGKVNELHELNVHKQIANRLLEPFQYMKLIVTATEWDNFFKLRLHEDSQPEIQRLAQCMKKAMDDSTPDRNFWHLPYVLEGDLDLQDKIKTAVAGCARVSYDMHDDRVKRTVEKDIALHDRLLAAGHLSPFEHVAKPVSFNWKQKGVTHMDRVGACWSNNFRGWIQYRALLAEGAKL